MECIAEHFHVKNCSLVVHQTIDSYIRENVQKELLKLFPEVACRQIHFEIRYYDDKAGEVNSFHYCDILDK